MAIHISGPNGPDGPSSYTKSLKLKSKPLNFTNLTYENVAQGIGLKSSSYQEIIGNLIDNYWDSVSKRSAASLKSSLCLVQLAIVVTWLGFLKPITRILDYYIRN